MKMTSKMVSKLSTSLRSYITSIIGYCRRVNRWAIINGKKVNMWANTETSKYLFLLCVGYQFTNLTTEPPTTRDANAEERASFVCTDQYGTCLKEFIKKAPGEYHAICQ